VLIFFIAGLLYLLRFERVDNLGAYSIPSDTGLLIPSDFISNLECMSLSLYNRGISSCQCCEMFKKTEGLRFGALAMGVCEVELRN